MQGHFNDVRKIFTTGEYSDSYAKHFATHFESKPTPKDLRNIAKMDIIWQGKPVSVTKTFKKLNCILCMRERAEIISMLKKDPKNLINSSSEIYGACRHNPKFHRFCKQTSTDERVERERVDSNPTRIDRRLFTIEEEETQEETPTVVKI